MENSYFRSPYHQIRHFPRHNNHHNHEFPQQSPKPKVVSIPVHFVESVAESNRRHSAAVRIQRHLRGFLVRRKVEAVRRIEAEVDEIERRIKRDRDLLLGEEKERIRTNEMLMALLLRLDSVRGVRDYRRKVIRRAILLQETVDSLSSSSATKAEETPETDRDRELPENTELEISENLETTTGQETPEEMLVNQGEEAVPLVNQGEESVPEVHETNQEALENPTDEEIAAEDETNQETRDEEGMKYEEIVKEEAKKTETGEEEEIPVKEIGVVDEEASTFPMEEDDECNMMEEAVEKEEESAVKPEKTENSEELGLKSVMERMVAENQNLKALVAELCERSSLQCKLMGGLAKRVAQLEKTVQTMERKKKKKREESK